MKSWKGLLAGILMLVLIIGEGTASAQQAKFTAEQKDMMAQTLADADENNLIGVSETGWIYYQDNQFRVRKRYWDGSQDQYADLEKLLYYTPPNGYSYRHNRNMNVLSIRDDQPFLNMLYDNQGKYNFFFQSGNSIVYWEGTETEEIKVADEVITVYTKGNVKVANLDGSGVKTLIKDSGNLDYYSMGIYNGYLYYVLLNEYRYGGELFRIGLDGRGRLKITDDYLSGVSSNAGNVPGDLRFVAMLGESYEPGLVINSTIFYHSTNHSFYRINIDGTKKIKLSGNRAGNIIDGGWMYYSELIDDHDLNHNGPIYKVKLGGGKPIQLTGNMTNFLTAKDDWIYYTYETNDGYTVLERKKADGSGLKQRIMSGQFAPLLEFKLVGDWFVYAEENGLSRVKLTGGQKVAVELYPKEEREW